MSVFKPVPQLDWLKELGESLLEEASDLRQTKRVKGVDQLQTSGQRVMWAYKYLLWSLRYQQSDPHSDEHKVAVGLLTKYHRKLYAIPPTSFERKMIAEAETLRKAMLAAAKKGKKP